MAQNAFRVMLEATGQAPKTPPPPERPAQPTKKARRRAKPKKA